MKGKAILAVLGALCAVPSAHAQETPASDDDDAIVVTGRAEPPPRREVFEQAQELSRVDPHQLYEEALPRFEAPLCPAVSGLRDDYAAEMTARIRANAARLEVPLAGAGCAPSLVVAFMDDGRRFLRDLERRHPRLFALVAASEREELLTDAAPVRAWNNIRTRYPSGAPVPVWRGREQRPSVRGRMNQMFLPTRRDIEYALVVFEREAVVGMSLVQLADYATMRGLSHTRPASGNEPMRTILALFEEDTAELTSFDIGYLRSLYYWKAELPAATRLLGVRRRAAQAHEDVGAP